MQKQPRQFKTMKIRLLGGKDCRIEKAQVADVQEQYTLGGGIDVVLIMKSGWQYVVDMKKEELLIKIKN